MNAQPDLRLLATFAEVARSESMAAAAKSLGYVPSAVSQQIAALERQLGDVELFSRTSGRKIALTAHGRALVKSTDDLLAATARFQDAFVGLTDGDGINIRVGAYGSAISYFIPDALDALRRELGDRVPDFCLLEIETADGLPLLERGELDILIAARYSDTDRPHDSDKVRTTVLGREPLVLCASKGMSGTPDALALGDHRWVAGRPEDIDRKMLERWSTKAGMDVDVRYETPDCLTAMELIAAGLAIGFLPQSVANAPANRGRLVQLPVHRSLIPAREVLAAVRPRFGLPAAQRLIRLIQDNWAWRGGSSQVSPDHG